MASSDLDPIYQAAAEEWNVHPALLKAIAAQESGHTANPDQAVSPRGARGRMQIMPGTAQELGVSNLADPVQNIYGGAKYLSQMLDRYQRPELALAAYNAGPGTVDAYLSGKGALPAETVAYVPSVTQRYQALAAPPRAQPSPASAPSKDDPFSAALAAPAPQAATIAPATPASAASDPPDPFSAALSAPDKATAPPAPPAAPQTPVAQQAADVGNKFVRIGSSALQGAKEGFGNEPLGLGPAAVSGLRNIGIYPPEAGGGTVVQNLNEAALGRVAALGDLALRGGSALFRAAQGAVAQTGAEIGQPQLGRDLASIPDAFMGSPNALMAPNRLAQAAAPEAAGGNRLLTASGPARAADDAAAAQGFRPLQPGEDAVPGQPIYTDKATGQQFVQAGSGDRSGAPAPAAPGGSPAPNSVGAAATTPGEGAAMSTKEALAARTQGERNRVNEPIRGQDTTIYVPGTKPTEAEFAGDPAVSFHQKQVSQGPATMQPYLQQMQANNDARVVHYENIAGSAQDLERMKAARSAQADADLQAAFAQPKPVDATPVVMTIQDILDNPRVAPRSQIVAPVQKVIKALQNPDGSLVSDPKALYGIRESITDMLSKPGMQSDATVANAQPYLLQIKNALDAAIEKGAPGYKQYLDNYSSASNPIDAMQFLQDKRAGLTDAKGTLLPGQFNRLMRGVVEDRATGNPVLPASKLTDDQMNGLFALHSDLKRLGNIDLSNPRGSDTNMLMQATGLAARGGAHLAAGYLAPVWGNAVIELGKGAIERNRAQNALQRVLRPDPRKYPPQPLN